MAFNNHLLKVLGNGEQVPGFNGQQQRPVGGFDRAFDTRNAALAGTHKYVGNTPFYSGVDSASGVKGYIAAKNSAPRNDYGGLDVNAVGPYRQGDLMFSQTQDGRYYSVNTKDPSYGTGQTKGDVYDASGKYLGSQYFDTEKGAIGKLIDKAIPLAAMGMIGGGIAGGFGVGPFAGGGAPGTAAMGAGEAAGGIGAAAGDAGMMYAGADAAAAGSLGGGGAALGGAGTAAMGAGAATAGSSGGGLLGSLGSIIKGGGGGMDFDWTDLAGLGVKAYGAYSQGKAADKAADAQIAANDRAMAMLAPWQQGGAWAMGRAGDMLGRSGDAKAKAAFYKDPGYAFRVSEGEKAINRDKARGGKFFSGERGKALMQYGQNMGSQEFANAFNRYMAMSGMGQTAAGASGGYASAIGDSQAAAEVARTSAWNNALAGMYNNWQQNQMMDKYFSAQGGVPPNPFV